MNSDLDLLYNVYLSASEVSTDSRKITDGSLFFALKGENFNGNLYAAAALKKGASKVVIDEMPEGGLPENSFFLVEDVLKTLQDLARHHRRKLALPIIGVGGSNGKTTSKELIRDVLAQKYRTFATPGNLNNHIGVPLSLLQIKSDIEIAVIELGANHEGEIAELCQIAEPNYGIITNIGKDHLEGFGSVEGVARANSELFYFLLKNEGKVFVNTLEEHLSRMASRFDSPITYPQKGDYFEAELLDADFFVKFKTEKEEVIDTQLFGDYNFSNIATALCIGKYFEVPSESANQAVADYVPRNNRSQVLHKRTNTVLLDAYNANPSSMQLAVHNFGKVKHKPKMIIVGDMNELGETSETEHEQLGKIVAEYDFDTVVFFGELISPALLSNPKAYYFSDKFSLHNWLQDRKSEETYFLIKGSRGVKLETVIDFI
jgi:UDP-N-acetylmuramoyl-tripeptide--D-alanyl-D-alanine ligase